MVNASLGEAEEANLCPSCVDIYLTWPLTDGFGPTTSFGAELGAGVDVLVRAMPMKKSRKWPRCQPNGRQRSGELCDELGGHAFLRLTGHVTRMDASSSIMACRTDRFFFAPPWSSSSNSWWT